jgi:hypothetical protein
MDEPMIPSEDFEENDFDEAAADNQQEPAEGQKIEFVVLTETEDFKKNVCVPYFKDIYKVLMIQPLPHALISSNKLGLEHALRRRFERDQ